jgi:hypothetical protein
VRSWAMLTGTGRRWFRYVVLCAAAAGLTAVAATAFASSPRRPQRPVARKTVLIAGRLLREFAIFRRAEHGARAAGDAQTLASEVAGGAAGQAVGVIPSDAQAVRVTSSTTVTVIPGGAGACLATAEPSSYVPKGRSPGVIGTCALTGAIETQGLSLVAYSPNSMSETIWGLLPDGATAVDVTTSNGDVAHVAVIENLFMVAGSGFRSITFSRSPGKPTTVVLP